MQSTEEYLDQLLASVSDADAGNGQTEKQNTEVKHHKSIEELDESELTEEALQKQLALLLGLETDEEDDEFGADDFMAQYAEQIAEEPEEIASMISDAVMDIPEPEQVAELSAPTSVETSAPVENASAPEISSTGVLSADEIAALFASMGAEEETIVSETTDAEDVVEVMEEAEDVVEVIEEKEQSVAIPATSDSGVLSPDEIATLFASMGADDSVETEDVVEVVDEMEDEDTGALTRAELEELGLGDIADVLTTDADDLEEISHPHDLYHQEVELTEDSTKVEPEEERQIVEIPDFDYDEEVLLDIENVDAMLEATAKMAEEENVQETEEKVEDDILSMLAQFEEESVLESMAAQEESARTAEAAVNQALEDEPVGVPEELLADEQNDKKKKEKKPKKEKVKKEKIKKEKPVKEKKDKVSLKDRIAAFMFEDESLDDGETDAAMAEHSDIEGLAEEKTAKAKKEKASKKEKKSKKSKAGKPQDENAAIEAELAEEDKKKAKKKEKPPKEKKAKKVVIAEKTPAEEEAERKEAKRSIGTKGIVATLLVCASILGLILVGTYFVPKQLSLMAARVAFYAQNYEEAAMRLNGQNLSDSDRIMYEKANLLYGLEARYHQYEIYVQRGMEKEALNALLQGVIACNKEEILAGQLGIETEWGLQKAQFVSALQERYMLDAETVELICALRNPDYTVAVENIMAGRVYNDTSAFGGEAIIPPEEETVVDENEVEENVQGGMNPEEMEDLLPEEEAIIEQFRQEEAQVTVETSEGADSDHNELYSGTVEGGSVNFVE